jgi:GTPase SAR1 family protein
MTIGVGFQEKELVLDYGEDTYSIKLSMWDLGGQKRFKFMHAAYCGGSSGYIAAFDMTRFGTLSSLDEWMDIFYKYNKPPQPTVIIGTKKDLWDPKAGGIPRAEIEKKMKDLKAKYSYADAQIQYFDTSSKTGEGVQEVFQTLSYMILDRYSVAACKANDTAAADRTKEIHHRP